MAERTVAELTAILDPLTDDDLNRLRSVIPRVLRERITDRRNEEYAAYLADCEAQGKAQKAGAKGAQP